MKRLLFIIFLFFFIFSSPALNLDSLWGIWNDTNQPDTNRLKAMHKIAWDGYLFSQPDSAFYFAGLQYELAESVGNKKWQANALNSQGVSFSIRGNYDMALLYFKKSVKIKEAIGDKKGIAASYNNIGNIYSHKGNYDQALSHHQKSLKIRKELGDKKGIASSYNNIGLIYADESNYDHALSYYQKSIKIELELNNKRGIANAYINMAFISLNKGNYKQALDYSEKSLKINKEIGKKTGIASAYNNIGHIYKTKGDNKKALFYYQKSIKIDEALKNKQGMSATYGNLGTLYFEQGEYSRALSLGKKGLAIAQQVGTIKEIKNASDLLYKLYKKIGHPTKALEMHELYIEMWDSINNEENTRALAQQQYKYEYEKKTAADSIKNAEKEKVMDAELLAVHAQNEQQNTIQYVLYAGIFLCLIFSFFVYMSFRKTNEQKKTIELQNEQIIERITYSQKVQEAILPSVDKMKTSMLDPFVFYEPKDIVSGDFYWLKKFDQHTIIACVDCTGHGVPGGFMSTMGSLLLDRISENNIRHPSEILSGLSDEVIMKLRQEKGGKIQDGMDMSVCIVDHVNKKIEFSGARNGIIVVSDGKATRHKADYLPVGGNYMKKGKPIERHFQDHSIELEKNDWVYMYTDGYMEQLGGENALMMNYKRFEDILIKLSGVDGREEKLRLLRQEIDEWKGSRELNDDMLIMGFQLS